jgi:hypothetical protein
MRCFPWAEWPLHSTELRSPAGLLEAVLRRPGSVPELADVVAQVRLSPDPLLRQFCQRVTAGNLPAEHETLRLVSSQLALLMPREFEMLRQRIDVGFSNLRRCLHTLSQTLRFSLTTIGAFCGPGDSWAATFKRCVRRTLELVRCEGGILRFTVAERGDTFSHADLEDWVAEVVAEPVPTGRVPDPDLVVLVDLPRRMDSAVSPWLVIADFVTNLMLPLFRSPSAHWSSREAIAIDRLGLQLRRESRPLARNLPVIDRVPGFPATRWEVEQRGEWTRAGAIP